MKAAASAKDIVVLVDGSGSMTGIRKEIARNVVADILTTLTEDDFVTILRVKYNVYIFFNQSKMYLGKSQIYAL